MSYDHWKTTEGNPWVNDATGEDYDDELTVAWKAFEEIPSYETASMLRLVAEDAAIPLALYQRVLDDTCDYTVEGAS